jgi:2-C-methyl-D-erythritol 4-phosphate cytidylyltransferase
MNIALILAGGLGLRMNQESEPPKQFFVLGDKPVLIHTLERFERHPEIDAICVVCLQTWENYLEGLVNHFGIKKVRWIVTGGDCRQASVFNGLCTLEKDCSPEDIIIVHDGVRPFITSKIISQNIETAIRYGNAMTSMQCTDTLITSHDRKTAEYAMDRDSSYSVQTPQTYSLGYGLKHYRRAYEMGKTSMINCCELFIALGEKVYMVNGRKTNVKLTTRDDIAYLKFLNSIFHDGDEDHIE